MSHAVVAALRQVPARSECIPLFTVIEQSEQEDTMPGLVPRLPFSDEPSLLDEINHRINNEFAAIIGVLSVTATRSANDEVKRALSGVAQLVRHYAAVHHALQIPDQETVVDAAEYLGNLCLAISRSRLDRMNITLVLVAPPLRLESGRCWRLGMIANELITNAARHAFAGRHGEIRIDLTRAGGFAKCAVVDNGSAPVHVQPGRGFRILEELSKGLDGRLEQKFGPKGSISTLIFPYDDQGPETIEGSPRPVARDHQPSRTEHATMPDPDHESELPWRYGSKTTH
jgi:two-component sensor histidine kinase